MYNQPTIALKRITSSEIECASKPPMKKVTKAKKAVGIYPNASTASKYKSDFLNMVSNGDTEESIHISVKLKAAQKSLTKLVTGIHITDQGIPV